MNIKNLGSNGIEFEIDGKIRIVDDVSMLELIADHIYGYVNFKQTYDDISLKSQMIMESPNTFVSDLVTTIDGEYYYQFNEDICLLYSLKNNVEISDNKKILESFKDEISNNIDSKSLFIGAEETFTTTYTKDPSEMGKYLDYINETYYLPYIVEFFK